MGIAGVGVVGAGGGKMETTVLEQQLNLKNSDVLDSRLVIQ